VKTKSKRRKIMTQVIQVTIVTENGNSLESLTTTFKKAVEGIEGNNVTVVKKEMFDPYA